MQDLQGQGTQDVYRGQPGRMAETRSLAEGLVSTFHMDPGVKAVKATVPELQAKPRHLNGDGLYAPP